jgi:potassium/hydrogen antiporter
MMVDPVTLFLLSIAAIFLIGALGEVTFQRTNIPDVLWLILAGVLLGPILGLVTEDVLRNIAPYFAALALVVVLFEGGTALTLSELKSPVPRSVILAVLSFLAAILLLAPLSMLAKLFGLLPDAWTWTHGVLLGTILGGSSSIIIMPAMTHARLPRRLSTLLNLESALTDALCVVGASALIELMVRSSTASALNPTGMSAGLSLLRSLGIGLAIGGIVGLVGLFFLRALRSNEHAYPVTLSALLILYVVIEKAGGSPALGILTVAVLLGNAPQLGRIIGLNETRLDPALQGFHRQVTFIVKSFFFVFIGAMLTPPWSLLALGVLLAGALLAARLPIVRVAMLASDLDSPQRQIIAFSMPRGLAAGVLATLPMARGIPGTEELPTLVFACTFTTIVIFAVAFPLLRARLPKESVEQASPQAAAESAPLAGPTLEQLRRAAIPKAPRTGFEESVLTSDSLEPDPRANTAENSEEVENSPSSRPIT